MSSPEGGPAYYARLPIQPIEVIEAWGLPHHLACVLKYLARRDAKHPTPIEDLEKARWYLDRYIAHLRAEAAPSQAAVDLGDWGTPV